MYCYIVLLFAVQVENLLDRHKLHAIFRLWDVDADGVVEQAVLEHALKR
jgi:Ca2+-binding EF-hand superfamily protein